MTTLEDDVRAVLHSQANAMHIPEPQLGASLARVAPASPRPERRWMLASAAVLLVVVAGVALVQRDADTPAGEESNAPSQWAFEFDTPTVRLTAQDIAVMAGGKMFVPTDVQTHSDPGNPEYTTLELAWTQSGDEQRIYMYFASDGVSWWADQINTYDGMTDPDWIESPNGERYFTTPLGSAYRGDLVLPNLHITNMTLEAFRAPASCDNPTSPIAVVAAYPTIEGFVGTGFGTRIDLIDTATCSPIDPGPYTFTYSIDDPATATVTTDEAIDQPVTGFDRALVTFVAAGRTTLRATVADSDGTTIGSVAMDVIVDTE